MTHPHPAPLPAPSPTPVSSLSTGVGLNHESRGPDGLTYAERDARFAELVARADEHNRRARQAWSAAEAAVRELRA